MTTNTISVLNGRKYHMIHLSNMAHDLRRLPSAAQVEKPIIITGDVSTPIYWCLM